MKLKDLMEVTKGVVKIFDQNGDEVCKTANCIVTEVSVFDSFISVSVYRKESERDKKMRREGWTRDEHGTGYEKGDMYIMKIKDGYAVRVACNKLKTCKTFQAAYNYYRRETKKIRESFDFDGKIWTSNNHPYVRVEDFEYYVMWQTVVLECFTHIEQALAYAQSIDVLGIPETTLDEDNVRIIKHFEINKYGFDYDIYKEAYYNPLLREKYYKIPQGAILR